MRVDNEVIAILSNAQIVGNALKLVGQLPRPLYAKTNKVLEAAGGAWNRKAQAHIFSDADPVDTIDQIILTGEIASAQDFGVFFSPPPVADRVIELAQLRPGMDVIEPNAGDGALASRAHAAGCNVHCVELLDKHIAILQKTSYSQITQGDFLELKGLPAYHRAIMNPPFARQADIHHVRHAMRFVRPDGLLVSVMSAGVVYRTNRLTEDFRAMVEDHGGTIEHCEEGAFRTSGTMVRAVIVTIPGEDYVPGA